MMKTALFAAAAAISLPAMASAQNFVLTVDPATGDAVFSADTPFVAFQLTSESNALLLENFPIIGTDESGNQILGLPEGFPDNPDVGADLAFSPIIDLGDAGFFASKTQALVGATSGQITSGAISGSTNITTDPAEFNAIIDVSALTSGDAILADLSGFAAASADVGTQVPISVVLIPEPATLSLAALGGVALLRRRR